MDLAREFVPSAGSIRAWVALAARKQDGREEAKVENLSAGERDELGRLRRETKQLRLERDILSRPAAWFARETLAPRTGGRAVRVFEFVSANQATFPIATMARVLGVSEAGYHAWRKRPPSKKQEADTTLLKRVRTVHASSRETYGAPRLHAKLRAGGEKHGCKRIARLMRAAGLVGASRRRAGITTTRQDRKARSAPDLGCQVPCEVGRRRQVKLGHPRFGGEMDWLRQLRVLRGR